MNDEDERGKKEEGEWRSKERKNHHSLGIIFLGSNDPEKGRMRF